MKQLLLFLFFLGGFGWVSAQTLDDCSDASAILLEELADEIAQDTPVIVGDTLTYCVSSDIGLFDGQLVATVFVESDSSFSPIKAIVTNRSDGDAMDTLDTPGDFYEILGGQLYFVKVIGDSIGTGRIRSEPIPFLINFAGAVRDTTEVRVIAAALPVRWAAPLTARATAKRAVLTWSVLEQRDVDRYEIQRRDRGAFRTVTTIAPKQKEGEIYYRAQDDLPDGQFQYRVKQVDFDGSFSYSNIASLRNVSGSELSFYPNPTDQILNYNLPDNTRKAEVFNVLGSRVLSVPTDHNSGALDVATLTPGLYIFSVVTADGRKTSRRLQIR